MLTKQSCKACKWKRLHIFYRFRPKLMMMMMMMVMMWGWHIIRDNRPTCSVFPLKSHPLTSCLHGEVGSQTAWDDGRKRKKNPPHPVREALAQTLQVLVFVVAIFWRRIFGAKQIHLPLAWHHAWLLFTLVITWVVCHAHV